MNKLMFLLFVLSLTACSKSVEVNLEPDAYLYSSTDSGKKIKLSPSSPDYQALDNWLKENQNGWYATSGRYPGGVYIRSGEHGIQVKELKVVLYSTSGEKPMAIYVKDIDKGELASLLAYKN